MVCFSNLRYRVDDVLSLLLSSNFYCLYSLLFWSSKYRCLINCGTQVSVTNRLSLTTACTGSAACISESLRYSWTLKKHTAQQTLELVPDLANIISTKLDSPGIVLEKVNSLESNVKYRLLVTTQADGVAEGVASYDFTTNSPPSGGTCNVSPTVGTALETEFRFTCSGWQDQNKPITYEFHYETDKGLYTVVSYGLKAEVVTKLPVGKASESFKLKFEAVIIDSLSAATKRAVNVKVSFRDQHLLSFKRIFREMV